jgi:hypothetical protein
VRYLPQAEAVYKSVARLDSTEKRKRGAEMILKGLIDFYRWLWGMKPVVIQSIDEPELFIGFGALIDIAAIVGIVGLAVTAYNDRKRKKRVTEYNLGYNDGHLTGYAEGIKDKSRRNNDKNH